jgi:hypothetical protein
MDSSSPAWAPRPLQDAAPLALPTFHCASRQVHIALGVALDIALSHREGDGQDIPVLVAEGLRVVSTAFGLKGIAYAVTFASRKTARDCRTGVICASAISRSIAVRVTMGAR